MIALAPPYLNPSSPNEAPMSGGGRRTLHELLVPVVLNKCPQHMVETESWSYGAVVDVETTGLGDDDEIFEFAIVRFSYSKLTGTISGAPD